MEPINSYKDMLPMDIIVTREKNPISWWIRMKSNGDWSHVCLAGEDGTIFTTTISGYSLVRASNYLGKGKKDFAVFRHKDMDEIKREYGLRKNREMLEMPYGYGDLFRMVMSSYQGKAVKETKQNNKAYFCAEAVAETYQDMGLPLLSHLGYKPSGMTPERCTEDEDVHEIFRFEKGYKTLQSMLIL